MGHMGRVDSVFSALLPIKEPYGVLVERPGVRTRMREQRFMPGYAFSTALRALRSGALRSCVMYTAPLPTALVINDDPSQLHLMVGLLEKDGLRVVHCQSAEGALDILDECGTVDVIITDLHMPGIDGWRLCQLLRSPQYAALNT